MGRYASFPQVEDLGTAYWHITRVLDPDEEFAEKQVLAGDGWMPAAELESREALSWLYKRHAVDALSAYLLGYDDGVEAAGRALSYVTPGLR